MKELYRDDLLSHLSEAEKEEKLRNNTILPMVETFEDEIREARRIARKSGPFCTLIYNAAEATFILYALSAVELEPKLSKDWISIPIWEVDKGVPATVEQCAMIGIQHLVDVLVPEE